MSAFFVVSSVFFMFPLLSPALGGVVVYPFLFYALAHGLRQRLRLASVPLVPAAALAALAVGLIDPVGTFRFAAFGLALLFLGLCARDARRFEFLLGLGAIHAVVVVVQLALVTAGFEIDFSEIFRGLYGGLLPATGQHIDYNAFSQFDIYVPRVAGLSREPAFASVLFTGLAFVAARLGRWRLFMLFALACLCTLSKIVFPLLAALALAWPADGRERRASAAAVAGHLALFAAVHLALIYAVRLNLDAVRLAMELDASFYHRLIGLHTFATQWDELSVLGNSIDRISQASIFQDYEFLADRRAFLDGSVVSKLAVDFGYLGLAAYAVAAACLARSWRHVLAIAVGGLFINGKVSPATVLLSWLLAGMHWRLPALLGVAPLPAGRLPRAARRSRRHLPALLRSPPPAAPTAPEPS